MTFRRPFVWYLAFVWLLVPYPYGLLLFFFSAACCGALYRSKQIAGRNLDAVTLKACGQQT